MQKIITTLFGAAALAIAVRTLAEETNQVAIDQMRSLVAGTNTLPENSAQDLRSPSPHPQGTLAPLPADYSLGASDIQERDDICEAVFRFIATHRRYEVCFIGFENIVQNQTIHHDATGELLKRLRDMTPSPMAASQADAARTQDGTIPTGVTCWLWGISKDSKDEAQVAARVESRPGGGGMSYRYRIVRVDGVWKTTEERVKDWL